MPVGCALERVRSAQRGRFVERRRDELHADRHAGLGEARVGDDHRQPEIADRAREAHETPSISAAASPVEISVSAMVGVWNDTTGPCTRSTFENTASQNAVIAAARLQAYR